MHLPSNSGGDFTPPPAGTHLSICYRVIDLGTQQVDWQGQTKRQHKIMLSWEIPDEKMEDGRPFTISQRYTFSSSDKSTFRQHLEAWRGAPFKDSDFGPGGFDVRNLIGKACLLTIVHKHDNGKVYANIASVSKPMKGMTVPPLTNETVYFSLSTFDSAVFGKLSDGLKTVIQKSPEYQEAVRTSNEPPPHNGAPADLDDEIPF